MQEGREFSQATTVAESTPLSIDDSSDPHYEQDFSNFQDFSEFQHPQFQYFQHPYFHNEPYIQEQVFSTSFPSPMLQHDLL